jgi:hypothetical protein
MGERNPRPWTTAEIAELRRLHDLGAEEVARQLGRSVESIRLQAHRQRVSLRRRGERKGRRLGRLGLPDTEPLTAKIRRAGLDVPRFAERIEQRMLAVADGTDLCPQCGVAPVEVPMTGWCRRCHRRELNAAYEHQLAELREQQRADALRQQARYIRQHPEAEEA